MAGSVRHFPVLRHGVYALMTLTIWVAGSALGAIPPSASSAAPQYPQMILRAAHPNAPVGGNGPILAEDAAKLAVLTIVGIVTAALESWGVPLVENNR